MTHRRCPASTVSRSSRPHLKSAGFLRFRGFWRSPSRHQGRGTCGGANSRHHRRPDGQHHRSRWCWRPSSTRHPPDDQAPDGRLRRHHHDQAHRVRGRAYGAERRRRSPCASPPKASAGEVRDAPWSSNARGQRAAKSRWAGCAAATFSFGQYHDPAWMGFGPLRVITTTPSPPTAVSPHRHANMEIVSVVLAGAGAHRDSAGHEGVVRAGRRCNG